MSLESTGDVIETDVLVIGGGVSGLWAANRARQFVERVLIVESGPVDWGGQCSLSSGGVNALVPGEDVDNFVKELVYYTDGLCDQDMAEEMLRQSCDRLTDLQKMGFEFRNESDGKLKGIPQRGISHFKVYNARQWGEGGKRMVALLNNEANRCGIKRLGRTVVTELLKNGDAVVGAIGFNVVNGEFYIFKANAVVLATGLCCWKISYGKNTVSGAGTYLAYQAGAKLKNFEFMRVWNVPRLFAWEGQGRLLPLGAIFVNVRGEPFMEKYSPALGTNTDPHYVVRAMAVEAREDRGPFYLDCSRMKPENRELMKPKGGWMQLNYEKLKELGMDFFEQKLEWMPQVNESIGGIVTNVKCQTSVPGLFAAGTLVTFGRAGLYMSGWHLMTTAVTGYIAGESAAGYAREQKPSTVNEKEVGELKKHLFAPLGKSGIAPKEVLSGIQDALFQYDVCILKTEAGLKRALHKMNYIKGELVHQMAASDSHYLLKLQEMHWIALATELFIRASLMREESRAGHYREDYPKRDDKNWLKWITISQMNGKLTLNTEPVPIDRYKFKPERYYMDNFTF